VSAPAPRGRCNRRRAAASGEGASRRQEGIGRGVQEPFRRAQPARVHWLIQNPQSPGALSIWTEEDPFPPRNYSMLKPFKVIFKALEAPWMGFMISKSLLWSQGNLAQRNVEGGL